MPGAKENTAYGVLATADSRFHYNTQPANVPGQFSATMHTPWPVVYVAVWPGGCGYVISFGKERTKLSYRDGLVMQCVVLRMCVL